MATKLNLITGATGLLGSHIAEKLSRRGDKVRALVRPISDVCFLRELDAELAEGDLADLESLRRAARGVDAVYHCAAKVGDWGKWQEFQTNVIDATKNILEACRLEQVKRVLYVSSVQVYGHPEIEEGQITEESPLGQNLRKWEKYARSKIEAEKKCREYPGKLSIIRPSWIYGPRDRSTLPRIINGLRCGRMGLIGGGGQLLNLVFAGDVADAAISAAESPDASGQAYNLSSHGEITQIDLFNLITDALKLPRVSKSLPPRIAYGVGLFSEIVGRIIHLNRSPYVTRYGVGLMLRPVNYSSEKAKRDLGWALTTPVAEGMRQSLQWHQQYETVQKQVTEPGKEPRTK